MVECPFRDALESYPHLFHLLAIYRNVCCVTKAEAGIVSVTVGPTRTRRGKVQRETLQRDGGPFRQVVPVCSCNRLCKFT
jgi:hypothetical protein